MEMGKLRKSYHQKVCKEVIRINKKGDIEYPNFADGSNTNSRNIAWGIVKLLDYKQNHQGISGQTAGKRFEELTENYIAQSFNLLQHLRPGHWTYSTKLRISEFEQYEHLAYIEELFKEHRSLEVALRGGYIIKPDIVVGRKPASDDDININSELLNSSDLIAKLTPLRAKNRKPSKMILHASISCKWTIRSDRSQNTRTEALNLIRNRKGPLPHIVAITAEPTPHRLASLALGTGDLDCVYHFALNELVKTIEDFQLQDSVELSV